MNIADQCVVSIHYRLTNADGDELDSSAGRDPLSYLHGASNIIPGLERELTGRAVGDSLRVTVQPADGYGEVNQGLIQVVPQEAFEGVEDLQPGMRFEASDGAGNSHPVVVTEVSDNGVTVDGNHPLAGHVLHFDVTVEAVRAATAEELEHGHVH
ncbi:MAG TPA: peptidylprolyl isomerase [Gammaproteobacteria bacterium]